MLLHICCALLKSQLTSHFCACPPFYSCTKKGLLSLVILVSRMTSQIYSVGIFCNPIIISMFVIEVFLHVLFSIC